MKYVKEARFCANLVKQLIRQTPLKAFTLLNGKVREISCRDQFYEAELTRGMLALAEL